MAGVLNVRADRAIQWPEKQEIGNLQLNFIKLSPKANPLKKAVIAATPLIAGLLAIWIIAVNIFQLESVMSIASSGHLEDIASAISVLTSTPDFWLWFYISFTIANTMFPTIPKDMKGWWQIGGALFVILITFVILGIGQNLLGDLTLSLGQIVNSLSLILILTITINVTMVMLLGAIESAIERITGHSATFQKGKMITMTREEVLKLKQEQQEKRLATKSSPRRKTTTAPASIYAIEFPIPGPPGQEPITKGVAAVLGMDSVSKLPDTTEEDEIFETTATDSTRQRMLKLFGDTTDDTMKSVAEDIPALPDSTSSTITSPPPTKTDDIQAQPKPKADIQAFSRPKTDPSERLKTPHIDDDESVKRATGKLGKDTDIDDIKQDKDAEKYIIEPTQAPVVSKPKSTISSPTSTPKSSDKVDETDDEDEEQLSTHLPQRSSFLGDTPKTTKDTKDDEGETDTPAVSTRRSSFNLPSKSPDNVDTKDNEDDEKNVITRPPLKTSVFDGITKSTPSTQDDESADVEPKDAPLSSPTLRSKVNAPSITKPPNKVDESDDEDDEQLSTRLPRKSSIFDDIANATDTDDEDERAESTPLTTEFSRPFAKRKTIDDNKDDDATDEEEPIIIPSSQFQRPFAPPKPDDSKSELTPSWRSQLASTSKSSDDDEDDEQLSTRLPRRSSMFDSLNNPSKDSKDSTPSWRSQLASTSKSTDDDEDDEQLSTQLPRRSSIFDSPTKSSDNKKETSTSSWRSQLTSMSSSDDEDDDEDEQLPRTGSLLQGLGRPQPQQPRSTIKGSGSRPAPKPTQKTTQQHANDWRSQLRSEDDDDLEDDEELNYEPIEDEFIYDDDDDYFDYDDD